MPSGVESDGWKDMDLLLAWLGLMSHMLFVLSVCLFSRVGPSVCAVSSRVLTSAGTRACLERVCNSKTSGFCQPSTSLALNPYIM